MLDFVRALGFGDLDFPAVSVAIDDVCCFPRLSAAEFADCARMPLVCLDEAWDARKVQSNASNAFNLESSARVLGVELVDGIASRAQSTRIVESLAAGAELLRARRASIDEFASLIGALSWNNLLSRQFFACLGRFHAHVEDPANVVCRVPGEVWAEFALNLACWPLWSAGLTRPWWPCLPAIDASASFGFGLSMASVAPSLVREFVASLAPAHHVRPTLSPGGRVEKNWQRDSASDSPIQVQT